MELGKERRFMVDFLFVITLFFVFAISTLLLVIIGANVYKKTVDNMNVNFNNRASFSYITEKIHQSDRSNGVSSGTFDGIDALILTEEIDDVFYCTYLYLYEGSIRELFIPKGTKMEPQAGQPILQVKAFEINQLSEQLYQVTIQTSDDVTLPLMISTHSN